MPRNPKAESVAPQSRCKVCVGTGGDALGDGCLSCGGSGWVPYSKMIPEHANTTWGRMAEEMLPNGVPEEVLSRLARVNDLIEKAGGSLNSRQVVALVIEQWEREKEIHEQDGL